MQDAEYITLLYSELPRCIFFSFIQKKSFYNIIMSPTFTVLLDINFFNFVNIQNEFILYEMLFSLILSEIKIQ